MKKKPLPNMCCQEPATPADPAGYPRESALRIIGDGRVARKRRLLDHFPELEIGRNRVTFAFINTGDGMTRGSTI